MSRDNISEMARVMCGREKDCLLCLVQTPCLMRNCAELLNAAGYRKASDVALEVIKEIKKRLLAFHLDESKKYTGATVKSKKQFDLETTRYRAITEAVNLAIAILNESEKKYTEGGK